MSMSNSSQDRHITFIFWWIRVCISSVGIDLVYFKDNTVEYTGFLPALFVSGLIFIILTSESFKVLYQILHFRFWPANRHFEMYKFKQPSMVPNQMACDSHKPHLESIFNFDLLFSVTSTANCPHKKLQETTYGKIQLCFHKKHLKCRV